MPPPSKVDQLPLQTRDWLNQELIRRGFGGYESLSDALAELGYEISKSALHRHGQALERRLSAIKASTEAAKLIADAAPDDEDARSAAVISMLQTDMFEVFLALQEANDVEPAERVKLLSRAATAMARLSRASINQKQWAADVRTKVEAKLVALEAEAGAGKSTLDPATLKRIREEIYGIVT